MFRCAFCFQIIRALPKSSKAFRPVQAAQQRWLTTSPFLRQAAKPQPKPEDLSGLKSKSRTFRFTWQSVGISLGVSGIFLGYFLYLKREKELERERERYRSLGKSLIGGPWELIDHNNKQRSSKDFLGRWYLIYFGFTHCPDVCPDELEKLAKVMTIMEKDTSFPDVDGVFFSVDPERDNCKNIKAYLAEFSPKILGFTGSKEQVEKVCRTFRVYHSEGPRDEQNDYIVDHTIVIYLINPDGQFVDYYSKNRTAEEISDAIRVQMIKYKTVMG